MFSEALLDEISEDNRKMAVLTFCNPVFMQIAKRHATHFRDQMLSLDPESPKFKYEYQIAKERLAAWQSLLKFASENAPADTQWGPEFERMLVEIGGFSS